MGRNNRKSADYEVGYGKPPRSSQFQPGQSGNPRGRPKRRKAPADQVAEILNRPVSVTENGKRRKVSSLQAFMMRQMRDALEGNPRAAANVMKLIPLLQAHSERAEALAAGGQDGSATMPAADPEILKYFAEQIRDGGFDLEEEEPDA